MSRHASELGSLLVEDLLGNLPTTIFTTLAQLGRLPLDILQQRTKLNRKQVKHGLAALIQQNLVLWSSPDAGPAQYEACLDRAHRLPLYGKYVRVTQSGYGNDAAALLQAILVEGSARICDLEDDWLQHVPSTHAQNASSTRTGSDVDMEDIGTGRRPSGAPVNGLFPPESKQTRSFHAALQALQQAALVIPMNSAFRRPDEDNHRAAESILLQRPKYEGGVKGAKRVNFREDMEMLLQQWREGKGDDPDDGSADEGAAGNKRNAPAEADTRPNKKQRIEAVSTINGKMLHRPRRGGDETSRDTTVLRANFDKLGVLLRNEMLVREAEKEIGSVTARVYERVLQHTVKHTPMCRPIFSTEAEIHDTATPDLWTQQIPAVGSWELMHELSDMEDLEGSIGPAVPSGPGYAPLQQTRAAEFIDEDGDESDEDDESAHSTGPLLADTTMPIQQRHAVDSAVVNNRTSHGLIRQHLFLLASARLPFLQYHAPGPQQAADGDGEQWSVPFGSLLRAVRADMIAGVIHAQHDERGPNDQETAVSRPPPADSMAASTAALRIARILQATGKLDEKALAARTLIPPKLLRARCAALHGAGLLELQEVPRDAQRQPARTIFLWYVDAARAARRVAQDAHLAAARLVQRRLMERERHAGVLDKADRSDVRGHESELLSGAERKTLDKWRRTDARLWGAVVRLVGEVAILMEY